MLVRFIGADGEEVTTHGVVGESVLLCAKKISVPGLIGECGGSLACATCHGYVDDQSAAKLGEPSEFELGMLSGCVDLRPGSRLTCQIVLTPELDGLTIYVPESQT